jgi:DNA repair protein RadD
MKMQLRPYQREAVSAALKVIRADGHPVLSLPTGSGKSLVVAEIARLTLEAGQRVLIVTHVQELVEGNAREFEKLTGIQPGVLCAGLERADKGNDVLFASVQSLYRPAQRREIAPFDVILVDECHLVADKKSGAKFYPMVFDAFPEARRVGLSATPYRLDGEVYGRDGYFTELAYEAGVLELIEAGYLAPLVGVNTLIRVDRSELKKVAGEFEMKGVVLQEDREWLERVVKSVVKFAAGREHVAVFCPGVDTAELAAQVFRESGWSAEFVVGDTEDRSDKLRLWKAGGVRVMCSVNVLTTGFNFPALDCIVCLRPTASQGLWVQMLGRGTRVSEGKKNCLVLDYSGNLLVHGGIAAGVKDAYDEAPVFGGTPVKVSAAPRPELIVMSRRAQHVDELTELDPMFARSSGADAEVREVSYVVIPSKTLSGKRLLMVAYECERAGVRFSAKQFVCTEYDGFAYQQAAGWFARRGRLDFPRSAEKAKLTCHGLPVPRKVRVRKVGKWLNVISEVF